MGRMAGQVRSAQVVQQGRRLFAKCFCFRQAGRQSESEKTCCSGVPLKTACCDLRSLLTCPVILPLAAPRDSMKSIQPASPTKSRSRWLDADMICYAAIVLWTHYYLIIYTVPTASEPYFNGSKNLPGIEEGWLFGRKQVRALLWRTQSLFLDGLTLSHSLYL